MKADSSRLIPRKHTEILVLLSVLQYSKFAFERPQVGTRGCQTCFLPQVPCNLIVPLLRTAILTQVCVCAVCENDVGSIIKLIVVRVVLRKTAKTMEIPAQYYVLMICQR